MNRSRVTAPLPSPPYVFRPRTPAEEKEPWFGRYWPCLLPQNKNLWTVEMRTDTGTIYFGEPSNRSTAQSDLSFIRAEIGINEHMTDRDIYTLVTGWLSKQTFITRDSPP